MKKGLNSPEDLSECRKDKIQRSVDIRDVRIDAIDTQVGK